MPVVVFVCVVFKDMPPIKEVFDDDGNIEEPIIILSFS
jgi:hypothetical protein